MFPLTMPYTIPVYLYFIVGHNINISYKNINKTLLIMNITLYMLIINKYISLVIHQHRYGYI